MSCLLTFSSRLDGVHPRRRRWSGSQLAGPETIELRVGGVTWSAIQQHVEDTTRGEEGAFLFCGFARLGNTDSLLVREWRPIPASAIVKRSRRYGLEWTSAFSSEILAQAIRLNASVVLVHSHGRTDHPELSGPDEESARRRRRVKGCQPRWDDR